VLVSYAPLHNTPMNQRSYSLGVVAVMSLLNECTSRVILCLGRLGRKFIRYQHLFYTESDMHCYLYYLLYAGRTFKGLIETMDGRKTILLHKELPTIGTYTRDSQGLLVPSEKGARGHFDIAIINSLNSKRYDMTHQRALIAVELGLDEDITHFKNDLAKLADARNDVKQGFIAHFAREKTISAGEYQAMTDLLEANPQIRSLIIDRSKRRVTVNNRLRIGKEEQHFHI